MIHAELSEHQENDVLQVNNRAVPELKASSAITKYRASGNRNSGASFVTTNEYINYTGNDIYIKSQNNIPIVLEASGDQNRTETTQKCLEVRTTYKLSARNSNISTKQLIEDMLNNGGIVSEAARRFYEAINQQAAASPVRGGNIETVLSTVITITVNELKTAKSIYLRSSDVVVSERREMMLKPHPNSDEGFHQLNVENARDYHGVSGVFVRVIDNERLLPSRFVYSAKQVVEIPSEVNLNQLSGVYVTTSGIVGGVLKTSSEYMGFLDAEERFGVYGTYGEAEANGDPERLLSSKIKESEIEISRLKIDASRRDAELLRQKQELEYEKQTIERDRQVRENDLATIRHTLKLREHELEALAKERETSFQVNKSMLEERSTLRKDYYDKRSTKRKDKSEKTSASMKLLTDGLKYGPGIIMGLYGIYRIAGLANSR